MKIWIRDSANRQYYFELLADNNRTLASSETYWNKSDCIDAARLIKRDAADAPIYDVTASRV